MKPECNRPGGRCASAIAGSLGAVLCTLAFTAKALELGDVLQSTAITPPAEVAFREERFNALLKEPLVLHGQLEYLAAGKMRKSIEAPFVEAFLIDADTIYIERDGKTRSLSLRRSRSLRAILGAIEAVLAGRADKLDTVFSHALSGSADDWTLRLTPRSARVAAQLTGLRIDGDATSVLCIRIDLKDGEWQRMDILSESRAQ